MPVPHRDPRLLALVAAGGALGTLARWGVGEVVGPAGGWPLATLTVNLLGAFLLGVLTQALLLRGPETPRQRLLRLGLGTGFCGGFTTWSSFAVDLDRLLQTGAAGTATLYALASLLGGLLAATTGFALAGARRPRGAS